MRYSTLFTFRCDFDSATFARLIEGGFLLKWTSDEMDNVAKIAEDSSDSSEPKPFVFDQIQGIILKTLLIQL